LGGWSHLTDFSQAKQECASDVALETWENTTPMLTNDAIIQSGLGPRERFIVRGVSGVDGPAFPDYFRVGQHPTGTGLSRGTWAIMLPMYHRRLFPFYFVSTASCAAAPFFTAAPFSMTASFFAAYALIAGSSCAITESRLKEAAFWRGGYLT